MKQMKRKMMLVGMMLTAFAASAQTFVSTQPGKRNALIEEYTGVNCQYCPLGHKATDQTVEAFPGRVFAINIHQGTFASRFTTQWGNALAGQASISGYPSSTLSRHAFFGTRSISTRARPIPAPPRFWRWTPPSMWLPRSTSTRSRA